MGAISGDSGQSGNILLICDVSITEYSLPEFESMILTKESVAAGLLVLLLASCTPPLESLSRAGLKDQIQRESGGAIQLSDFTKTGSKSLKVAEFKFYTVTWKARITAQRDFWKGGNALVGFWSDFHTMTRQPGTLESLMFGGNSTEFVKGAAIEITGETHVSMQNGEFRAGDATVTSSRILSNERTAEELAAIQRQRDSALAEQQRQRDEAEKARLAAEAAEYELMLAEERIRDSTVAVARSRTDELARFDCELLKEGMADAFMIDSLVVYRYVVTAGAIYRRPILIRSTRSPNWTTLPDNARDTIWFDELRARPTYGRASSSRLARSIRIDSDRSNWKSMHCNGNNNGFNRADSLQFLFGAFDAALSEWSAKYPGLVRW